MYIEHREIPSKGYFWGKAITIGFTVWTCGFALSGAGVQQSLDAHEDWKEENVNFNNTELSSICVLGLTLGSVFSKPFTENLGRRATLLLANAVIVVVTIPCMFMLNLYVLSACRFILGFVAALQVNGCSLIVAESIPTRYQNTVGTSINSGIVMGIFVANLFNLLLPYNDPAASKEDKIWRVSFSLHLVSVVINVPLWLFVFRHEPLRYLVAKAELAGKDSKAYRKALSAICDNYGVEPGSQSESDVYAQVSQVVKGEAKGESPGYLAACIDPKYRRATFMCVVLSITNQGTGINAINLYSTQIYQTIQDQSDGGGISPNVGAVLNIGAELIACLCSSFVIYFNFRTIMNGGLLIMTIILSATALLAYYECNVILVFVIMLFLATY